MTPTEFIVSFRTNFHCKSNVYYAISNSLIFVLFFLLFKFRALVLTWTHKICLFSYDQADFNERAKHKDSVLS